MAGIKAKNTKPVIMVRKALHELGFRFRLLRKDLLGRPDIVLQRHCTVVLVKGHDWHGHEHYLAFRPPQSRTEFWCNKIAGHQTWDARNMSALQKLCWHVVIVWQCAIKGRTWLLPQHFKDRLVTSIASRDQ